MSTSEKAIPVATELDRPYWEGAREHRLVLQLCIECGLPDAVSHIVAAHAGEGDMVRRSVEATIVHHADFMSFLPFKDLAKSASPR